MSKEARRGAIYNYLNLLLIAATGIFLTPYMVRCMGASQYGLYALVGALIPYLSLLDLGMSKTITRYVAHYRTHNDEQSEARFLTSTTIIYGFITIILLIIGASIYHYSDNIWSHRFTPAELADVKRMIPIIVMAHAIIIPGNGFTAICNGCGKFAFPRIVLPIKYVIRIVCIVSLLAVGYKALALIALEMVLNIAIVIATYIYVRRHIGRKNLYAPQPLPLRPILQYSGWIALYATTCALQWSAATIIAGTHFDAATVGVVGIGIMIGTMYGYLAETINRMTLPRASRLMAGNANSSDITADMVLIGRLIAIPLIAILSTFALFGNTFIQLWAGEGYEQAYTIALVMMASWTIQLSQEYGTSLLEAKGMVRTISVINFICIFAGVIASYIAARHWGIVGMICAIAGGTLVATIANSLYYSRKLPLQLYCYYKQVYGKLIGVTTVCVTLCHIVQHYIIHTSSWIWLIGSGGAYIIMYSIAIYCCVLNKDERQVIKKYVRLGKG